MNTLYLVSAAAAAGALAVPASAQQAYSYSYPQQAYPQQAYPQQAYPGYQQGYSQPYGTNPIEQVINSLLGNNSRYTVSDRTQVSRCASAALAQAQSQSGAYGYGSQYRQPYGAYGQQYGQTNPRYGYNPQYGYNSVNSSLRVTAITQVKRRPGNGLRVAGLISSGASAQAYGYQGAYQGHGYQGQGYQGQGYADPRYARAGDLSFRCNVDYRGTVSAIRVSRSNAAYRR